MSTRPQPVVILLAEDDPDDQMLAVRALHQSSLGTEVKTVDNGEDLLDYLHRRGAYVDPAASPSPSLILLDLNMPRKDGREALREIKMDPRLRRIPVIVLTTSQADEDILRTYDLGVNAYVTKPITFAELTEALRSTGNFWLEVARLPPLA